MGRFVALLRGMNLGKRRITNVELSAHFEALGCAEPTPFRASGNVVFGSEETAEEKLNETLEAGLGERLGYPVPVFLRSGAELAAIVAASPFDAAELAASTGKVQVVFLRDRASAEGVELVVDHAGADDRLVVEGRELFWLPRGGLSESDLDLKALETGLGPTTIRTLGTVEQLARRAA